MYKFCPKIEKLKKMQAQISHKLYYIAHKSCYQSFMPTFAPNLKEQQ